MDFVELLLGTLVLVLVGYLTWHYVMYGSQRYGIPMYPVVGIGPAMSSHYNDIFDFLTSVLETCPNLAFFGAVPGQKWIFSANPEHLEYVLKTNFDNFEKGENSRELVQEFMGNNIFVSDGESWKLQRKVTSYEFTTTSLKTAMVSSIHREIESRLLPTLQWAMDSKSEVDLQDVLLRFTFDNICSIGFGVDPEALSTEFPRVPFAMSIDRSTQRSSARAVLPPPVWKLMRALSIGDEQQLVKDVATINTFVEGVIRKRREETSEKGEGEVPKDFLSAMIALGKKNHGTLFSDTFLRDACLALMVAGRDTTASAMTWFFWILSQHPSVEEKILEEIASVISKREEAANGALQSTLLSFDELKELTYTQAALNESMRLFSPAPMGQKVCIKDDRLPDGTFIGKGWRFTYCIYAMGRMKRIWGEDAGQFRPERWIGEDGKLKAVSPFQYPVFNAGPRLCLGKELAYLQMKSVVSSVLQRFRISVVPRQKIEYVPSITLPMRYGLKVSIATR